MVRCGVRFEVEAAHHNHNDKNHNTLITVTMMSCPLWSFFMKEEDLIFSSPHTIVVAACQAIYISTS